MTDPSARETVRVVLARHGRTFASEAGIRIARGTPSPLFRLLVLSLLVSARIRTEVALAAARALSDAGWTTASKMAAASWEERTRVLNTAGYARYDESTSRYLGATAELVLDRYRGDLRRLRAGADGDRGELTRGLTECTGIGELGASFFLREVQAVWTELVPFADDRVLDGARRVGLDGEAGALHRLVDGPEAFARLVAALVRVGLADDADAIREEAGRR